MKVFLGGTCNESTWREDLKLMLRMDFFDPVVDDWNEEAQERELHERKYCAFVLYVITPKMSGVYSIAEAVDDSNKRPNKTLFCYLESDDSKQFDKGQIKSLDAVGKMIDSNGARWFSSLENVADYLNYRADNG